MVNGERQPCRYLAGHLAHPPCRFFCAAPAHGEFKPRWRAVAAHAQGGCVVPLRPAPSACMAGVKGTPTGCSTARGADARIQSFLLRPGCCFCCSELHRCLVRKSWYAGLVRKESLPAAPARGEGIALQGRGGAAPKSGGASLWKPPCLPRAENAPMAKTIKTVNGWGGRRSGAGRPAGSRNKPRLIRGLPETHDPLQWLLALMAHEGATLRQRMAAARVLLPYFHRRPGVS